MPADPPTPLLLTDLRIDPPGLARAAHGLAHQEPLRFARRVVEVGAEVALARLRDAFRPQGPDPRRLLRVEAGEVPPGRSLALYVHYSGSGVVSAMVRRQLELWRDAGFATVFITMAPSVPEADWAAVRALTALVVQRANFGRDFGAWCDLVPLLRERFAVAGMEELLLANDSVLGPIRPFAPVVAALRSGGPGVFGLTESHQGGTHLQSYGVLARGGPAVADLLGFLGGLRLSVSKWLVVQRGELSLARHMLGRGHRVAALFGYAPLLDATLSDTAERDALLALHPRLAAQVASAAGDEARAAAMREVLLAAPLNPTHHLWRALVRRMGFPYLKTELVRRNPGRLPGIEAWPDLVVGDSPVDSTMIAEHLATMGL
jgi:hypothetical protein